MKKVTISFRGIVELRKFQHSLDFLGIDYQLNEENYEVCIIPEDIKPIHEIEISSNSTSIVFRNEPK